MDLSKENTTLSVRLSDTCNIFRQFKLEGLRTIDKLKEQNTKLSAQNTDLSTRNVQLTRQSKNESQTLQELRDRIAVLESDNASLHKDVKVHRRSQQGIEYQLMEVKKSYHDALSCISEMTEDLGKSSCRISKLETWNNQLSTGLHEAQKRETEGAALREALRCSLRDAKEENDKLRSEIGRRIKSEAETNQKLAKATERNALIKEECENMRKRADDEENNVKLLRCKNSELTHRLLSAEEERTALVNRVGELDAQVADLTLVAVDAHGFKTTIFEAFKCSMLTILFC